MIPKGLLDIQKAHFFRSSFCYVSDIRTLNIFCMYAAGTVITETDRGAAALAVDKNSGIFGDFHFPQTKEFPDFGTAHTGFGSEFDRVGRTIFIKIFFYLAEVIQFLCAAIFTYEYPAVFIFHQSLAVRAYKAAVVCIHSSLQHKFFFIGSGQFHPLL